jgi:hypothetical protein
VRWRSEGCLVHSASSELVATSEERTKQLDISNCRSLAETHNEASESSEATFAGQSTVVMTLA